MKITEAWELLMNSPKVIRVNVPVFLVNLENGKLANESEEHVKPLTLHMRNLDEQIEDVKDILDECDVMYIMGEMQDVFKKNLVSSEMTVPGMSIEFIRYTFRYYSITYAQLLEWYNQSVHTKTEVAKCQAKKQN
jgi:hypothetical protein